MYYKTRSRGTILLVLDLNFFGTNRGLAGKAYASASHRRAAVRLRLGVANPLTRRPAAHHTPLPARRVEVPLGRHNQRHTTLHSTPAGSKFRWEGVRLRLAPASGSETSTRSGSPFDQTTSGTPHSTPRPQGRSSAGKAYASASHRRAAVRLRLGVANPSTRRPAAHHTPLPARRVKVPLEGVRLRLAPASGSETLTRSGSPFDQTTSGTPHSTPRPQGRSSAGKAYASASHRQAAVRLRLGAAAPSTRRPAAIPNTRVIVSLAMRTPPSCHGKRQWDFDGRSWGWPR
ncbi:hypothetical protein RHS01_11215 [Rhizoctonia solani]|uniref:Uncharacterized protein n=1 Tax=Rhizoctonia solani TaxID=456999 RepID=A0A8H7I0A3_9AGAM|nr:hypothetical protein RHS01_11215 [Rhizoctonia solani]